MTTLLYDFSDFPGTTEKRLRRFGVKLAPIGVWAEFGISGASPHGIQLSLENGEAPNPMELARFHVERARAIGPAAYNEAADAIETLAERGIDPLEVIRLLFRLEQFDAARARVKVAKSLSTVKRGELVALCVSNGVADLVADWADSPTLAPTDRIELLRALGRSDQADSLLFEADAQRVCQHVAEIKRLMGDSEPQGIQLRDLLSKLERYCRVGSRGQPIRHMLLRAAHAKLQLRLFESMPTGLVEELRATGVDECCAQADELVRIAEALHNEPIPALRRAVRMAPERTEFVGRLALALDSADDPEAPQFLRRAYDELLFSDPIWTEVKQALQRRGVLEVEEEGGAPVRRRKSTPETKAWVEELTLALANAAPDEAGELEVQLALAHFKNGDENAGSELERLYLLMSYNNPTRDVFEAALQELGLW